MTRSIATSPVDGEHMSIESLEKRKLKLAELRDADGNPIDQRKLTHAKFLSSPNVGSGIALSKSRMDEPDRIAERELLAKLCELTAELMDQLRPSLRKASDRNDSRKREAELLTVARKLRGKGLNQK
jgi:hypothetical protein